MGVLNTITLAALIAIGACAVRIEYAPMNPDFLPYFDPKFNAQEYLSQSASTSATNYLLPKIVSETEAPQKQPAGDPQTSKREQDTSEDAPYFLPLMSHYWEPNKEPKAPAKVGLQEMPINVEDPEPEPDYSNLGPVHQLLMNQNQQRKTTDVGQQLPQNQNQQGPIPENTYSGIPQVSLNPEINQIQQGANPVNTYSNIVPNQEKMLGPVFPIQQQLQKPADFEPIQQRKSDDYPLNYQNPPLQNLESNPNYFLTLLGQPQAPITRSNYEIQNIYQEPNYQEQKPEPSNVQRIGHYDGDYRNLQHNQYTPNDYRNLEIAAETNDWEPIRVVQHKEEPTPEPKAEIHYHQHKHLHKHEHLQDHKHIHEQEHKHLHQAKSNHEHLHSEHHGHKHDDDHKHVHKHEQEHHHAHGEDHKHAHEHKHDHAEGHRHAHRDMHKHEHDHKGEHKHDHVHKGEHKNDHHHAHKHDHHGEHKHDHNQAHQHNHHHGHKHGHVQDHKHGHKQEHKHGHEHAHKHGHKNAKH